MKRVAREAGFALLAKICRRWRLAALVVVGALIVGGAGLWRAMGRPFYEPGMLRAGQQLRGPLEPPRQPGDKTKWLVEADIALNRWSAGSGRAVLVVHGGPGYPFLALPAGFEPLVDRYEFHFYDQRGCGDSTRLFDRFEGGNYYKNMVELERTLGIGAQVADIERIRRILREERLILMGHSFGALLATLYAAEFPDRVRALVLVAPSGALVLPNAYGDIFQEIRRRLPADRIVEYDAFVESYLDFGSLFKKSELELAATNRRLGEYFLAASPADDALQQSRMIRGNGGWMVQAMYLSMGAQHDYRPALTRITAPTLVVHGEDDILPEGISRMYAEGIHAARFLVLQSAKTRGVAGADHFAFADDSAAFAEAVGTFLDSVKDISESQNEHED